MISHVRLRDFKGHQDTELELGRFTVLVGDNASGKTSLLEALEFQAEFALAPITALRGQRRPIDLLRRGASGSIVVGADGVRNALEWQAVTTVIAVSEDTWSATLRGNFKDAFALKATNAGTETGVLTAVSSPFGVARIYRVRAERVAAAAYSTETEPVILADGTNTAVVLAALKLADDESFDAIQRAMRELVPSIDRLRIRRAAVRGGGATDLIGSKVFFDFRGANDVPAEGASHGTLIVLSLLTVLFSPNRPNLILLDDFDHALHPRAQIELVRLLKKLVEQPGFEDLQIVATTHSPYVLDEMDRAQVIVFALDEQGIVRSKPLSQHPQAAKVEGTLTAGQLWSLAPEEWVLAG